MAEYIEREAALNVCEMHYQHCLMMHDYCGDTTADNIKTDIETIPTADVVEVVRCKDCQHWLKDVAGCTDFVGRCEWANYMVGATGYCVYGEAKMDGKGEGE